FREGTAVSLAEATRLYQDALNNEALEDWFVNEAPFLDAYVLYRLLLTRTIVGENVVTLGGIFQALIEKFPNPDENGNIYVDMARAFWDSYQIDQNISNACLRVQAVIADRPEAIDLLNQYGNRSPIYTKQELCPY